MPVPTETARNQYTLSTSGQSLPYTFYILEAAHVLVLSTVGDVETVLEINTDYSVTGAGNEAGGNVIMVAGTTGDIITIVRSVPITQLTDYVENDRFPATVHEKAIDKLTMICQALADANLRNVRAALSDAPLQPMRGLVAIPGVSACINGVDMTITILGRIES
jgi:hypothetical protein